MPSPSSATVDVGDLDPRGVLVFSAIDVTALFSVTPVGAWFGRVGRRVDPELRVVGVAAAVLADDVEVAVVVHRHALVRLVRHRERVARVGRDRQRARDVARAVDVHDLARLLADDQQVARVRCRSASSTFDSANTSEKSAGPASAGSKRLIDSSVVGEPLVAVPAAQSMPVWKIALRLVLLDDDEAAASMRVVGDALEADVADRRAELDRLRVARGAASCPAT